jgi:mRNA interferase HicA
MKYRKLTKRLRDMGCEFVRNGAGSHRIWWNPANDRYTTIPDWGSQDLKIGTLRRILADLGVAIDDRRKQP